MLIDEDRNNQLLIFVAVIIVKVVAKQVVKAVIKKAAKKAVGKVVKKGLTKGSFSISNWNGYPKSGPKPQGPFKGKAYTDARKAANKANQSIHRSDPSLKGKQIHEIHPVKFGGSPTDKANNIPLTPKEHAEYTKYWNNLQRNINKKP